MLLQAVASGLAQWHLDSLYHGATGSKTVPRNGGFSRQCPSSGRSVYPRIDPAIITLVTAGKDWCLLGRKKGWPQGRWARGLQLRSEGLSVECKPNNSKLYNGSVLNHAHALLAAIVERMCSETGATYGWHTCHAHGCRC